MVKYQNLNKELKIVMISPSGNLVFLEDGSRWEVLLSKKTNPASWHEGERVCIFDPGHLKMIPTSEYKIKNIDRGEIAQSFVIACNKAA